MAGPRRDVLAAFKKAKAVFFYKTMTTTMVADGLRSEVMRLVSSIMHLFCFEILVLHLIPRPDTVGLRLNVGQELPTQFAMKHGEEMNQVVALVRPASCGGGEWSLMFEGCHCRNYESRVYVYGGGWRDFVLDSGISIGDFLVFELMDRSRLIVYVYPHDDQFGIRSIEEDSSVWFKKTMHASHGPNCKVVKMVSIINSH